MSKISEKKAEAATASPSRGPFFGGTASSPEAERFFPGALAEARGSALDAPEFAGVEVTIDSSVAQQIGAKAFTQGESIHFAPGQYDPGTHDGKKLIGHELEHVVQQREGRVKSEGTTHGMALNRSPALEAEAHRAGDAAARGEPSARPIASPRASVAGPAVVQGEFAVEPTVANPVFVNLTAKQVTDAITHNQAAFTDADEIAEVRDVIGISSAPAVVDEDFVRGVARYQAQYGLTQDGMIGASTADRLATEFETAGAHPGLDPEVSSNPAEMAMGPAGRRMRLRAQVRRRLGVLTTQAFVGDRLRPTGVVTTRAGEAFGGRTNLQSVEYTGQGGATAQWLQFAHGQLFGFAPGSTTRVNFTGTFQIGPAGAAATAASTPGAIHWAVDSASPTSPFYGAGFLNERVGNSHTLFDVPGGASGNAMVAGFAAASGLDRVTFIQSFESYLVRNNDVVSRVNWSATSRYTIAAGVATSTGPFYNTAPAVGVTAVRGTQRTVLNTVYPANGVH
jgi:hypothetical protein